MSISHRMGSNKAQHHPANGQTTRNNTAGTAMSRQLPVMSRMAVLWRNFIFISMLFGAKINNFAVA